MPTAGPDPLLGTILADHLRLERRLGAGGMGAVYVARDLNLKRDVAVKILLPEATETQELLDRIQLEAEVTANLSHPGIPKVHTAGVDRDTNRFYFVQELLSGCTLEHDLYTWRPPPRFAISRVLGVLDALAAAHDAGVVHRDVKPANIFLAHDGPNERVCLLDFGISKLLQSAQYVTRHTRGPLGTPHYFAPETITNAANVDVRADVWAAGIVLYEMLARSTPWQSTNWANLLTEILACQIPDVRHFCPWDVPDGLVVVLRRALQPDPRSRYRNAADFARAIRALNLQDFMSLTTGRRARRLGRLCDRPRIARWERRRLVIGCLQGFFSRARARPLE